MSDAGREGPATAFSALYQSYAPDVFRFVLYLSGNRGDAEDITAEAFARLWASPVPVQMETVKGYLFTIARNLFLQSWRKRSRQVELAGELPDPQASAATRAEVRSELRAVMSRLNALPEVDRAALLLRAVAELPYEEIARSLGISLAAAKVKVHRARRALSQVRQSSPEVKGDLDASHS